MRGKKSKAIVKKVFNLKDLKDFKLQLQARARGLSKPIIFGEVESYLDYIGKILIPPRKKKHSIRSKKK